MDDAAFTLTGELQVLHQAGIRHLLRAPQRPEESDILSREPWPALLAKVPPAPRSIWTYAELGFDLTGRSDPARGNLWRTLIQLMDLPRGFVGFFPHSLPAGDVCELHLEHFFEAIVRIGPKTVLLFDDDPLNPILKSIQSRAQTSAATVRFHCAPSPKALLKLSREEVQSAAERIKRLLNEQE